jgi:hypothetical protein
MVDFKQEDLKNIQQEIRQSKLDLKNLPKEVPHRADNKSKVPQ